MQPDEQVHPVETLASDLSRLPPAGGSEAGSAPGSQPGANKALGARRPLHSAGLYLLIVLVVVIAIAIPAGFLWLEYSGLTRTGTGYPAVSLGKPQPSNPNPGLFYVSIPIAPVLTFNVSRLVLYIANPNGTLVAPGSVPASCSWESGGVPVALSPRSCGLPTRGWYAALTYSNGMIASVFNGSAGGESGFSWSPASVPLGTSMSLWVISGSNLAGAGATLWVNPSVEPEDGASVTL